MNYTTFFKNVNIQSILTIVNDCSSQVDLVRQIDMSSALNDNIWLANSKIVFASYLDKNNTALLDLKNTFDIFIEILTEASQVKDLENEMEISTDTSVLNKDASEIKRLIADITQKAVSIKTPDTSQVDYSKVNKTISEIRIDYNTLNNLLNGNIGTNNISTYVKNLNNGYKILNGLQAQVCLDDYLYYVWHKTIIQYDEIIKRTDSLSNWLANYLNAVKAYEEAMPESVPSVVNSIPKVSNYKDHSSIKVELPSLLGIEDEEEKN